MLDLFNFLSHQQPTEIATMSAYLVPILVLIASLFGSSHCVGMCGGIAMALPGKSAQIGYHSGRLTGYLSLGAVAGFAGDSLLNGNSWLTLISAVMMAAVLVWTAVKVWRGQPLHIQLPAALNALIQKPLGYVFSRLRKQPGSLSGIGAGFSVGALTVFLPCGWLYTFVIGALSTRNLGLGALYLFAFWLGTVPLLALGPQLVQRWLTRRSPHQRHVVAALFLCAGLLSIGLKSAHSLPIHGTHQHKHSGQKTSQSSGHHLEHQNEHDSIDKGHMSPPANGVSCH